MGRIENWKQRAKAVKREARVMYLAVLDPRTPWYARVLAGCVVAYALSPIDLIPDPIPVVGYLDDLLIVPAGVWLTRRLIPAAVLLDCRARADSSTGRGTWFSTLGLIVVVILWIATALMMAWAGVRWIRR